MSKAEQNTVDSGNFPFPEVVKTMTDEQKKDANRTRSASIRKAQGIVFDAFKGIMGQVKISGTTEVSDDTIAPLTLEAYNFLSARATRGVGRPAGSTGPRQTQAEKLVAWFLDPANQTVDGAPTPGKIAGVNLYISRDIDMDATRALSALKRFNDDAEPENRVWISYDSETRVWTIEGKGADAPANWTGPLPTPKKEKDLSNV